MLYLALNGVQLQQMILNRLMTGIDAIERAAKSEREITGRTFPMAYPRQCQLRARQGRAVAGMLSRTNARSHSPPVLQG